MMNKTWLNKFYFGRIAKRWITTEKYDKVNSQIYALLESKKPLQEIIDTFNKELKLLKAEDSHQFKRRFGSVFDPTLKRLLLESLTKTDDKTSTLSIVESLQALDVVKPRYFLNVIRYLYRNKDYKTCFEYWVKYSAQNYKVDAKSSAIHKEILVLIINTYLLTTSDIDLQFLQKFLGTNDLSLLEVVESIGNNDNEQVMTKLQKLFVEFAKERPQYLKLNVGKIFSAYQLKSFYAFYKSTGKDGIDVDVLVTIMKKMDMFDQVPDSIEVFNDFKTVYKIGSEEYIKLCNQFLVSVSKLSGKNNMETVQALWNSYFENSLSEIPVSSYCALLEAIYNAGGINGLNRFWNYQLSEELKNNSVLTEIYLSILLNNPTTEVEIDEIIKKFKNIETVNLKCTIMLRIILDPKKTKEDFENFYIVNIGNNANEYLPKVVALKLYADYHYGKAKQESVFFPSVKRLTNDNLCVLEELVWIIPDKKVLHSLFNRFKHFRNSYFFQLFLKAEITRNNPDLKEIDNILQSYISEMKSQKRLSKLKETTSKFIEFIVSGMSKNKLPLDKMEQYLNLALSLNVKLSTSTKLSVAKRIMDLLESNLIPQEDLNIVRNLVFILIKVKWEFNEKTSQLIKKRLQIIL